MHRGHFYNDGCNAVHDGADRCEVVQGHKRVHFEFGGIEEALDQGQTDGLKDDTARLVQEAGQNKGDFTVGCNHDANDDEGNVAEGFQAWGRSSETPCG